MRPDAAGCLTCGDVAVVARVVGVAGDTATVEVVAAREQAGIELVGIELVGTVAAGDFLLCHAGIALAQVEGPP